VDLLQPYHNNNTKLGTDLVWEDFLQAHLIENDDRIFKLHTQNSSSFESESKDHGGEHVVTAEWWKVNDDFERIHSASFENEPFVWEIRVSYWYIVVQRKGGGLNNMGNIIDDILPKQLDREKYVDMLPTESKFPSIELEAGRALMADISRGCTYVRLDYSPAIKRMQQSLENEIRRQSDQRGDALVGLLHLRRGDTVAICDTSLEKIRSYLHCSLDGSEGFRNIMLVMTSEENDVSYRKSILGLVDEFRHLTILDGDGMTQRIVDNAARLGHIGKSMVNAVVVFAVEGTLRDPSSRLAGFRLARRRQRCPDCDPAVYQALDPSKTFRFRGNQLYMTPIEYTLPS